MVVVENNVILGPTPGSPNGGRDMGVAKATARPSPLASRTSSFPRTRAAPGSGAGGVRWTGANRLATALPHPLPRANHTLLPLEKALAFLPGLLGDARKLTHVSYLRRDPLVPELLGITRVASQSGRTRCFPGFTSAGGNLRCFRPLWQWGLNRLPSAKAGDPLALDSTRLRHKDGEQEGVAGGYPKQGIKPCLPPLLAEVRLVAQRWLRPGNPACGNNVTAFFLDWWENLPRHIRLRGVRADSGFCLPERLALWEALKLPYVGWQN